MRYGIVVDSGCDIKEIFAEGIAFNCVALKLDVGEKEFVDDIHLDIEEFMKEMSAYKGKTGSAAPSPADWMDAYEKADEVFAITITGALSGSYASAKTAYDMSREEDPNRKICLIDSKSAGPEISLLVYKLIELMQEEKTFEEIQKEIIEYQTRTHLLFTLGSMDNLVKNGRIGRLQGSMAGILGIKILGYAGEDGTFNILHKCRGKYTALDKAWAEMERHGYAGGPVAVCHCFNSQGAEYLKKLILENYKMADVKIMPASGLCSYYAENGGILIGYEV